MGEEEVVRHRRDHGRDGTGRTTAGRSGQDHDDDERERDVRRHHVVVPERHEDPGDDERSEACDGEPERLEPIFWHVATLFVLCHDSGIPTHSG